VARACKMVDTVLIWGFWNSASAHLDLWLLIICKVATQAQLPRHDPSLERTQTEPIVETGLWTSNFCSCSCLFQDGWLAALIRYVVTPTYLPGYGVVFWTHIPQSRSSRQKKGRLKHLTQRRGQRGQDVQTRSSSSKVNAEGDAERTFIGGLGFCWLTFVVRFDFKLKSLAFFREVLKLYRFLYGLFTRAWAIFTPSDPLSARSW
jgi:hypothetical protein